VLIDYRVQLLDAAGALVGDNKQDFGYYATSDETITYGTSSNTWGASPTAAMVKDADFGVVLSTVTEDLSTTRTASIDFIRMTVYYTASEPSISVSPATYSFGVVSPSSTYNTTTTYFTLTNASTVQTDQSINVTSGNWTGGVGWYHNNTCTPGVATAGLKANRGGTWGTGDVIVGYSASNYIYENCPASTNYQFGLSLHTPTEFTDGDIKTIVVRITAIAG